MPPEKGLLVCGNLNIDMIYRVQRLPTEGRSTPILGEGKVFGGCGGNIAMAAGRLGARVKLSSVVGKDLPGEYRIKLDSAGVDLTPLKVSDELPSPYCIVLSAPDGKQAYAFNMGSMKEQKDMDVPLEHVMRYTHIATSDPSFTERCASELSMKGSIISFDPGMEIFFRWDRSSLQAVLEHTDIFFGNLGEWEYLAEQMGWSRKEFILEGQRVSYFREAFDVVKYGVITLGERGAVLMSGKGAHHEKAVHLDEVVDATGAGDAFRGGFFAALLKGIPMESALKYGNVLGSLAVSSEGPQDYEAEWDAIEKILK